MEKKNLLVAGLLGVGMFMLLKKGKAQEISPSSGGGVSYVVQPSGSFAPSSPSAQAPVNYNFPTIDFPTDAPMTTTSTTSSSSSGSPSVSYIKKDVNTTNPFGANFNAYQSVQNSTMGLPTAPYLKKDVTIANMQPQMTGKTEMITLIGTNFSVPVTTPQPKPSFSIFGFRLW